MVTLPCVPSSYDDDGNKPRICTAVIFVLSFAFTLIFVIVLEIMNAVHWEDGFWIRRYDIRQPPWCEASYADHNRFIMEPANARSDYLFVAMGCWMMILALSDLFNMSKTSSNNKDSFERDLISAGTSMPGIGETTFSDHENGEAGLKEPSELEAMSQQNHEISNGIIRYPHITFVHGIFNLIHGLGSFWYHACECEPGAKADVAGMLAVASFPIWYAPLQLVMGAKRNSSPTGGQDCCPKRVITCLSVLPPIGQLIVWILAWNRIITRSDIFILVSQVPVFGAILYIYCWKNERSKYEKHSLNLWLILIGLLLFALAFVAWILDKNGTWCMEGSWFQGHAVWHIFAGGTLTCLYLFYRTESITLIR